MNALYAKEARLLRPAFWMALLLAIVPAWFAAWFAARDAYARPDHVVLIAFEFGIVMLAISSFGREFGLGTFALLLAQPIERRAIWRAKTLLLAAEMAVVFAAWSVSCGFWLRSDTHTFLFSQDYVSGAACLLLAYSGGLWTTLLLRQMTAAFLFTVLVPVGIALGLGEARLEYVAAALCLYAVAGFWWARWQFLNAQEVGWTGGVVTIPSFRKARGVVTERRFRPWAALLWKEVQLHQVALLAMAGLFVFHLGAVELRQLSQARMGNTLRTALEVAGGVWILIPLLASCVTVAEERKLGTLAAQLCQPISRRAQFGIKLCFSIFIGGILTGFLFCAVEGIGNLQETGHLLGPKMTPGDLFGPILAFCGLAFVGFYASTLARNMVQALAAAVVSIVAMALLGGFALSEAGHLGLWRGPLAMLIGAPALFIALLALAWRNFRSESGSDHLWRGNALALGSVVASVTLLTFSLYHRVWEFLTPIDGTPGVARIEKTRPVALSANDGRFLIARFPDGRLWAEQVGAYSVADEPRQEGTRLRLGGYELNFGAKQFLPGTNWATTALIWRELIGIRTDGTLWVPRDAADPMLELVRFGSETNWQAVVRDDNNLSLLLLKNNGTLWRLGTNSYHNAGGRGLSSFTPQQLLPDSKWDRILSTGGLVCAWKDDGTAWWLHESPRDHGFVAEPFRALDSERWRALGQFQMRNWGMGLREDGTLWIWHLSHPLIRGKDARRLTVSEPTQIGASADWVGIASDWFLLVAQKKDGSLWQWDFQHSRFKRMGNRNDWVGVTPFFGGTLSLAADGNLFYWQNGNDSYFSPALLGPTRRPALVGNIFSSQ